jgi:hypothetical protein
MIDDVEVVENIRRARLEKRMAWISSIIAGVVFMVASAVLGHNLLIGTVFVTAGMAGVCSEQARVAALKLPDSKRSKRIAAALTWAWARRPRWLIKP